MRLFTGIAIAPHVLGNLARVLKDLRPLAPLHWSPVENLHVTSKFIGEWPDEKLMELEEALEGIDPPAAFDVQIARFGYFPNPHNPRALFAGVHAGAGLGTLARQIEDAVKPLGVAREDRPYAPHLTLARMKHQNIRDLQEHIANMTNFDFGTFRVTDFQLFLSQTGPRGSAYSTLASYPLPAAAVVSK
ncbi:MAG: RNA 2',3'-cyclic phosphodiesterase [Acidobacteriota bacterium]|nr:RNA 2',3'-cyclic phosphodiesterase [Acidobacteriota bacterium]